MLALFLGFPVLQAMESWAGPGDEASLVLVLSPGCPCTASNGKLGGAWGRG